MKITKDMLISDLLDKYPDAAGILVSHGMGCLGCPSAQFESIEQAAAVHGMDVEKLLEDLNK
jgi:hybrid cluster-associated redox disulfide protein